LNSIAINSDQKKSAKKFVRVAVNLGRPSRMLFSYHLKDEMKIQEGNLVLVPFAKRILAGIVVDGPLDLPGYQGKTRPVDSIVNDIPAISTKHMSTAKWIINRYLAPFWETYSMMLPPGINKKPIESVMKIGNSNPEIEQAALVILDSLAEKPVPIDKLKKKFPNKFANHIAELEKAGLISKIHHLPYKDALKKQNQYIEIKSSNIEANDFINNQIGSKKTKIAQMIKYFILNNNQELDFDSVLQQFERLTINKAIKKNLIKINDKNRFVSLNLKEKSYREILDETCFIHEKKSKDILAFLIDKSNYVESFLSVSRIVSIFGRSSRSAIKHLYYCKMINFVDQVNEQASDHLVNKIISSKLIEDQKNIYKQINDSINSNKSKSFLLYGPNQSGKKEICLHLLKSLSENADSALVLCPTIEKSQLFFDSYKKFFDNSFNLMNSQFSKKEFQNKWNQINNLDSQIIVSTKFGFTLPIKKLKLLIVLDAEHFSYKQNFNLPKYDIREIAEYLSKNFNVTTIFLSTTMDSYLWFNAYHQQIERMDLSGKINKILQTNGSYKAWRKLSLPNIKIDEIKDPAAIFSNEVINDLRNNADRGIQSIVIINRRGYARYLECRCGKKNLCNQCNSPISVQQSDNKNYDNRFFLFCYQCGYRSRLLNNCPQCKSQFFPLRVGTGYVEEQLRSALEKTKIVRLDSDSIVEYGSEQRLHNAIKSADIIIGTKKVLDIHDLRNAAYVCLLLPEYHNNEYDYQHNEGIFQFVMEAADIVDNNNPLNKLVIQALNPNNEVIHLALQRKADEFYSKELEWRSIYEYPPLVQLFKFEFSHIDGSYAAEEANRLYRLLKSSLIDKSIKIFGPIKLNNDVVNNKYRWTIYVKGHEASTILHDVDIPFGWQVELNPDNIA